MSADDPLVLVTSRSFGSGRTDPATRLTTAGLQVVHGPSDHDVQALAPVLARARAWIAGAAPIEEAHLARAPHLRLVARYGTGTDAVDLAATDRRGVLVTNTPGANAEAVADHTLGLLLAVLRRVTEGDRAVRAGETPRLVGRELAALTAGLVGFGAIGRAVARRLRALCVDVRVVDPAVPASAAAAAGVQATDLAELVAGCDVVSLHRPGSEQPVLDAALLAALRDDAVVINTARASLIDEHALAAELRSGRLLGVGLDVVSGPRSPLHWTPRTILTPHVAGQTTEAVDRMGAATVDEVLRVLVEDVPVRHPVTLSERHG